MVRNRRMAIEYAIHAPPMFAGLTFASFRVAGGQGCQGIPTRNFTDARR